MTGETDPPSDYTVWRDRAREALGRAVQAEHDLREAQAERDALERAIRSHGGVVLRGDFVLREGETSHIYVDWPPHEA